MNTKHILLSSALLFSTALGSRSFADDLTASGSDAIVTTTDTTTITASGSDTIADWAAPPESLSASITLDDSGDPLYCDPDNPLDCGDEATLVYVSTAGVPKTTKWQYYKCLLKAQAVRTACDVAFAAVQGAASAVTGGASGVATTVAGVGIVQDLQACYALYKAQKNGCRIDHGLKPED